MQSSLHALTKNLILASHHGGREGMFGHLSGQVRPRQHTNPRLRRHFFEYLTHQLEAVGLNALGQAHQQLACQAGGQGLQHIAQGAGWQRDKNQLALRQGGGQIGDRMDAWVNLDAFQVTRVFPLAAHRLGLGGVAHPLVDLLAIFGQQVGDCRAETTAAKHGNGLLFSHNLSLYEPAAQVSASVVAIFAIIRPTRQRTSSAYQGWDGLQ